MKLFNTISIETGARCTRKCWFCPVGHNHRPHEFMKTSVIRSILITLRELEYSGRVELYIYNEPLLDKRLVSIVQMVREYLPKSCIMIASNTDLLHSPEQIDELYSAGLNQLQLNIYSNMTRYREVQHMVDNLKTPAVEGNIYENSGSRKKLYRIERKFDKAITPESPKIGKFELNNRSGNVPDLPSITEPLKATCVRPFRYMQVNWKGDVILCCNDYHGEVVVGNVEDKTVDDIWFNSPDLTLYRTELLAKNRSNLKLCSPCSFKGGAYTHFLPKQWPELIP